MSVTEAQNSVDWNVSKCHEYTVYNLDSQTRFFDCLAYFARRSPTMSLIFGSFTATVLVANALVIIFGCLFNRDTASVFDKLLIAHSLANFINGLVVFPFVFVSSLFAYWPLSREKCLSYLTIENTLACVDVFHIFYMSWIRIRSIKAPSTYTNEFLVKHALPMIFVIWIASILFWSSIAITLTSFNVDWLRTSDARPLYLFTPNKEASSCVLLFEPSFASIFIILSGCTLPILLTLFSVIYVILKLKRRQRNSRRNMKRSLRPNSSNKSLLQSIEMSNSSQSKGRSLRRLKSLHSTLSTSSASSSAAANRNSSGLLNLNPQTKLTIISATFVVQYLPYGVIWGREYYLPQHVRSQAHICFRLHGNIHCLSHESSLHTSFQFQLL